MLIIFIELNIYKIKQAKFWSKKQVKTPHVVTLKSCPIITFNSQYKVPNFIDVLKVVFEKLRKSRKICTFTRKFVKKHVSKTINHRPKVSHR